MPVTAAKTLRAFQLDAAARTMLRPDPAVKYTPKTLYDKLMKLDVPTTAGTYVTVKITKYLNTATTPNKDSNGGPGFATLTEHLRKVARSRGNTWSLPLHVNSPALDLGSFQCSVFSPFKTTTAAFLSPLAPAQTTSSPSYFPLSTPQPGEADTLDVDNWELWRFFCGKASPPEIRRALFLAQAAGVVAPTEEALQSYCNEQAGMDCSGFASVSYGYETTHHQGYSATQFRTRGIERATIEEIRAGDAIVWLQENHIALVDQVGAGADSTKITCKVAESTAGLLIPSGPGVQYSEYVFECDDTLKQRRYKCHRPKAGGGYYQPIPASRITVRGNP